jgi:hypothetical protein
MEYVLSSHMGLYVIHLSSFLFIFRYLFHLRGPPKVMTVFQTAVLIIKSNFYRKCKVEMKEHMFEIVHKLCPENHLR